jgi:hypothetical protein
MMPDIPPEILEMVIGAAADSLLHTGCRKQLGCLRLVSRASRSSWTSGAFQAHLDEGAHPRVLLERLRELQSLSQAAFSMHERHWGMFGIHLNFEVENSQTVESRVEDLIDSVKARDAKRQQSSRSKLKESSNQHVGTPDVLHMLIDLGQTSASSRVLFATSFDNNNPIRDSSSGTINLNASFGPLYCYGPRNLGGRDIGGRNLGGRNLGGQDIGRNLNSTSVAGQYLAHRNAVLFELAHSRFQMAVLFPSKGQLLRAIAESCSVKTMGPEHAVVRLLLGTLFAT